MIDSFQLGPALLGGALIGLAATFLLYFSGRIAGISGILAGILSPEKKDLGWRLAFVLGLLAGGYLVAITLPQMLQPPRDRSLAGIIVAGLLVGFGVRLGNGCTSGHGVCGISRMSSRSWIATIVFLIAGIATATLIQWARGG